MSATHATNNDSNKSSRTFHFFQDHTVGGTFRCAVEGIASGGSGSCCFGRGFTMTKAWAAFVHVTLKVTVEGIHGIKVLDVHGVGSAWAGAAVVIHVVAVLVVS